MTIRGDGRVTPTKHGRFRVDVRGVYIGTFQSAEEAEQRRAAHAATLPPPGKAPGGKRPGPKPSGHISVRYAKDGARYAAKWRNKVLGIRWERKEAQALIDAAIA